jgi:hypothetical protein
MKCLMRESARVLFKEVVTHKREVLTCDDWKFITSLQSFSQVLGENLLAWVVLCSRHKEQLSSILKEVKDFSWHEFSQASRIHIFLLGKELEENHLKQGMYLMLTEELQEETILRFLSEDDWMPILSQRLFKQLWVNLKEWIRIFPQQEDRLPMMLSNITYVSWRDDNFSTSEREELFMIGKEIGKNV